MNWRNIKYYDQFNFINMSDTIQYLCSNIFEPNSATLIGDEWDILTETVNTFQFLTNQHITKEVNVLQ